MWLNDANALYKAYIESKRGSDWKAQVQKFEMNFLLGLATIQSELETKEYELKPVSNFVLRERGKTRQISGEQIPDRIVKHVLCDDILNPAIKKYLIHDNGASQKGKGISFARKRLVEHLIKYYNHNHTNEGYILLMDFSKYYDNIRHDLLMKMFKERLEGVEDEKVLWILEKIIKKSRIDVSYMNDEEYENCMDIVFDSLAYHQIDKKLLTGEKFMNKHLNIGDQLSQTAGIFYPTAIDNYIKIVKGMKYYGRYMDDSYVIHHDKEFLKELLNEVYLKAKDMGITINLKKTQIKKLSDYWRFLQIQYSLHENGRITQKINPKRLTAIRRKMKKIAPRLTLVDFTNLFKSWYKGYKSKMSRKQRENITKLFNELKEVTICNLTIQ